MKMTSDCQTVATCSREIRIAIFVCFLNAGVSACGIEIAKALRKLNVKNIVIRVFSWKGPESITYEHLAKGFDISYYGNTIDQETWSGLLKAEHDGRAGLMHDKAWMKRNIQGAIKAIQDFSPTVVVHGIVPEAAVASQILHVPNFLYGPIPLWDHEWMESVLCRDVPDAQATWLTDFLPLRIRQGLMHVLFHQRMKARTAIMDAATECQWTPTEPPSSIFRSDYYLLKDLRSNYEDTFKLGANIKFVGPMYPKTRQITADEEEIVQEFLLLEVARKLFVTMGSSGAKEYFIEAVKAIGELSIPALVALAPGRCSIKDIESAIGAVPHHVFLTEKFVPADIVASQVDVVISHGGQGTVQTALGSGTPIVGVGMQWEQQFNLDNAARQGAAVRIDKRKWNSYSIQEAVTEVLDHESYSQSAKRIQKEIVKTNSADTAARFILDIAQSR